MQKLDETDAQHYGDLDIAMDFSLGVEVMKGQAEESLMNMNLPDVYIANKLSLKQDLQVYFVKERPTTALFTNCACLVVKPHALDNLGSILDMVLEDGFEVSAMQLFNL